MAQTERKLARHLGIDADLAAKLVKGGLTTPSQIKALSKRKLREAAGITQKEANAVTRRWQ